MTPKDGDLVPRLRGKAGVHLAPHLAVPETQWLT